MFRLTSVCIFSAVFAALISLSIPQSDQRKEKQRTKKL